MIVSNDLWKGNSSAWTNGIKMNINSSILLTNEDYKSLVFLDKWPNGDVVHTVDYENNLVLQKLSGFGHNILRWNRWDREIVNAVVLSQPQKNFTGKYIHI